MLDDGDLTMVSQGQEEFFGTLDWTDYYSLGSNDLVGFATALGAERGGGHRRAARFPPPCRPRSPAPPPERPQVIAVKVDPSAEPPYYT